MLLSSLSVVLLLTCSREVVKCGLLYVGHGQQDEKEILKNDALMPSGSYHEFVKALGPIVCTFGSYSLTV
jgi:hypothetical protein